MLKRKSPLRRTGALKRAMGLPRVNAKRKAKLREQQFGRQAEVCRQLPCAACGGWTLDTYRKYARKFATETCVAFTRVSDPQHCPTRGAGGLDGDTLPLCREHHDEAHSLGEQSFNAKYGIDQRAIARAIREALAGSDGA